MSGKGGALEMYMTDSSNSSKYDLATFLFSHINE